jgi:peptidoglycan hydrolase-like protein with peptidoglycan-binding domain
MDQYRRGRPERARAEDRLDRLAGAARAETDESRRLRCRRRDGRYGPKTETAVKKLQQQSGIAVDGVVGPKTWSVIDALENEGPAA